MQPTTRTYVSGNMQSAMGAQPKNLLEQSKHMKSINKSLAKLDQISTINWSKKDMNLEILSTTADPKNNNPFYCYQ